VKFGKDGEWATPRMVVTQWQGLKEQGADARAAELNDPKKWVVVWPKEYKTGDLLYPFSKAR
jgi:branched-chain amino acid transport system substrate-binding protein